MSEPVSIVECRDCKEAMRGFKDGYFGLAIVDPPYGIKQPAFRRNATGKLAATRKYNHAVYKQGPPDAEYFTELFRVSKNQIIWGGNYFTQFLPAGKQWIFWDKATEKTQWGDGELAWTSFTGAIVKYTFAWNGMIQGNMKNKQERIHPTEKPFELYRWLLENYAKKGDRILDTHLGSGSHRVMAYKMGFDFWGYESDPEYFAGQEKRFLEMTTDPFMNLMREKEIKKEQGILFDSTT